MDMVFKILDSYLDRYFLSKKIFKQENEESQKQKKERESQFTSKNNIRKIE